MERPTLFLYKGYDVATKTPMILKYETNLYTSLQWENCFNDSGSIEIHMPFAVKAYEMFEPFTIIKLDRNVKENLAIVIYRSVSIDEKGHTELTIKAKTLSYVLTFRGMRTHGFVVDGEMLPTKVFDAVYRLLRTNTGAEGLTIFGRMVNLEHEQGFENNDIGYNYNYSGQTLYDSIAKLCKGFSKGFYMMCSPKETFPARLRLYQQKENNNIEFNLNSGNIISLNISSGIDNYVSGYFFNDGYPLFCGGVNANDEDIYRIERAFTIPGDVAADTSGDGYGASRNYCRNQIIAQHPMTNEIVADVTQTNKHYLTDYSLGDIVPVKIDELGISAQYPIVSVREIWEERYKIEAGFGERMLTMWQKINRRYGGSF